MKLVKVKNLDIPSESRELSFLRCLVSLEPEGIPFDEIDDMYRYDYEKLVYQIEKRGKKEHGDDGGLKQTKERWEQWRDVFHNHLEYFEIYDGEMEKFYFVFGSIHPSFLIDNSEEEINVLNMISARKAFDDDGKYIPLKLSSITLKELEEKFPLYDLKKILFTLYVQNKVMYLFNFKN